MPDENFITQEIPQQNFTAPLTQPHLITIQYTEAGQYYFVGPNGTPMLAPPPPPFPQYSIDQADPVVPYSLATSSLNNIPSPPIQNQLTQPIEQQPQKILTKKCCLKMKKWSFLLFKTIVLELKKT